MLVHMQVAKVLALNDEPCAEPPTNSVEPAGDRRNATQLTRVNPSPPQPQWADSFWAVPMPHVITDEKAIENNVSHKVKHTAAGTDS
jgi:hypothetical protein